MIISKDDFCRALSGLINGVTIVTTKCAENKPHGITVTAFSSLSLEPPLVLICIHNSAAIRAHLGIGHYFAVNILSEYQEFISQQFASKAPDRFNGIECLEGVIGLPLIKDCLANIECRIIHAYPGGDHTIFVGEVESVATTEGDPLAYFRRRYVHIRHNANLITQDSRTTRLTSA